MSTSPCLKHRCSKCCIETEMPLTKRDIQRIENLGFKEEDFVRYVDGIPVLKTKEDGSCVFLEDGKCKIYKYRPDGCRLYPLVWVKGIERATLDPHCPYRYEFRFTHKDVEKLAELVKEIYHHEGSGVTTKIRKTGGAKRG